MAPLFSIMARNRAQDRDIEMYRAAAFIRFILFCVFFTAGATAIVLTILADELEDYYEARSIPTDILQQNEKLRRLTEKLDQQIERIKTDPGVLRNLDYITFGVSGQNEAGTVSPTASDAELLAAESAYIKSLENGTDEKPVPKWLARIIGPKNYRNRLTIFVAGSGLIIITFIFFGSLKPNKMLKNAS